MKGSTYKYGDTYLSVWDDGSFRVVTPVGVVASGSAGSYMSPDVQNNPKTYHLPDKPPKMSKELPLSPDLLDYSILKTMGVERKD